MRNVFLIFLILSTFNCFSQEGIHQNTFRDAGQCGFLKSYVSSNNEVVDRIYIDHDGNYLIYGQTNLPSNKNNATLLKLNSFGEIIWAKQFGDGNSLNLIKEVIESADGFYYAVGYSSQSSSVQQAIMLKLTKDGALIWSKSFNSVYNDKFYNIIELSSGNFLVSGRQEFTSSLTFKTPVLKISPDGNMIFGKLFQSLEDVRIWTNDIYEFDNEELIIMGSVGQGTNHDGFMMKLSATGNMIWSKWYGLGGNEGFTNVIKQEGNEILITGNSWSLRTPINTKLSTTLLSINSTDGSTNWSKGYYQSSSDIWGRDFAINSAGNIVIPMFDNPTENSNFIGFMELNTSGDLLDYSYFSSNEFRYIYNIEFENGFFVGAGLTEENGKDAVLLLKIKESYKGLTCEFDNQPLVEVNGGFNATNLSVGTENTTLFNNHPININNIAYNEKLICESEIIEVNLGNDTTICAGDSILIGQEVTAATYLWNNGSTNATIYVQSAGSYSVEINTNSCENIIDTIVIATQSCDCSLDTIPLSLGNDTTICETASISFNINIEDADLLWSDGSTLSTFTATEPGIYWVEATVDMDCSKRDSITINTIECGNCEIFIPNAFSPNGDNLNEYFKVRTSTAEITNFKVEIYNRWGNLIFTRNDKNFKWDGKYEGQSQSSDVFVYQIYFTCLGQEYYKKGNITLIR